MSAAIRDRRRLLALAALLAALAAVLAVFALNGGGSYRVNAIFSQVYGLVPGAEVEAGGVNVGTVKAIGLDRQGLPRVSMSIDGSYRLRTGASASVQAFSLTGEDNRFVALQTGTGQPLPDGATLPLSRTSTPVEIYQVLDTLDPRARAQVRALLAGLDASLAARGPDLEAALAHSAQAVGNTAALLAEVNSDGEALRTFVRDGSDLVATLASDPSRLGGLADSMAATLQSTAARQSELALAAARLAPGLQSPTVALSDLDRSIGTLRTLVADATPGVRALVPFSRELVPVLQAAPRALLAANALVRHAPADVHGLAPLVRELGAQLPPLEDDLRLSDPMLDQIRVRLPDLFSFFANWADFSADYDANGHAARIGLVFPPAPTNPIGPCSTAAGSLAFPFLRAPGALGGQPWTDYAKSFVGGAKPVPQERC
jgi:phospholipid/cholesterol/gamma-HCH transport system substrate-binding protein